jgi:hypothetical protein
LLPVLAVAVACGGGNPAETRWATAQKESRNKPAVSTEALAGIEGKLQVVAAFLDITTNYYSHTGTQTVARSLITRAAGEI